MASILLGQIVQGGWNFAPRGFALCNGQLLAIAQNTALFALLGTTYGGNGQTTFALPDLRGRSMVHWGQGAGLSNRSLGQAGGSETNTLTAANLPAHSHTATFANNGSSMNVATAKATVALPSAGAVLARSVDGAPTPTSLPRIYAPAGATADAALSGLNVAGTVTVNPTGNNSPVNNLSPYLVVTFVIATEGIFPSRN